MASPPAGTVHLVDDDPSVPRSLVRPLGAEGIEAVAWNSAAEFPAGQGTLAPPACAVLDLRMPGMDGIPLQEELAARGVKVPIIFLSAHADVPTSVRGALERSELMMRQGHKLEGLRARHSALTQREREVLGLVVRGQLNKEIASGLGAAEKTIKVHRGRVMRKMGAGSLAGLVQQTVVLGLLLPAAPAGWSPGTPGT